MMGDMHATTGELFAAAATFTLLAWGFAYSFVVLQAVQPGSFAAAVNAEQPRSWTELMFLSFALLSSTGKGAREECSGADAVDSEAGVHGSP